MDAHDRLQPAELHSLWLQLPEHRRFALLVTLDESAADALLSYQLCRRLAGDGAPVADPPPAAPAAAPRRAA